MRELENAIEQALVFADGTQHRRRRAARRSCARGWPRTRWRCPPGDKTLPEILEDLERQLIQRAYDKTAGVKTETARLLGIKTSALYYKLEKYGIGVIAGRASGSDAGDGDGEPAAGEGGRRWRAADDGDA